MHIIMRSLPATDFFNTTVSHELQSGLPDMRQTNHAEALYHDAIQSASGN